ncbi:Uncharacterised protein [Mycobacterium tuberculosis]|nr:Uncharacterised protein [Mycobacterium tuberculosis]
MEILLTPKSKYNMFVSSGYIFPPEFRILLISPLLNTMPKTTNSCKTKVQAKVNPKRIIRDNHGEFGLDWYIIGFLKTKYHIYHLYSSVLNYLLPKT